MISVLPVLFRNLVGQLERISWVGTLEFKFVDSPTALEWTFGVLSAQSMTSLSIFHNLAYSTIYKNITELVTISITIGWPN